MFLQGAAPTVLYNMVAAHHSLDKQTRHTSINIPQYSSIGRLLMVERICGMSIVDYVRR